MKNNYTKLVFLLDRSGSMQTCKSDTDGGFNSFIEEQRKNKVGKLDVSLYQFDDVWETVYSNLDIDLVPKLDLQPRNMTALLDAICKTIDKVGKELADTPESERPAKVIFIILTDGGENSSKEFNIENVKQRITLQQNTYNWSFVFLGANIDTWSVGNSFGIATASTCSYASTGHNSKISNNLMYSGLCDKIMFVRSCISNGNYTANVVFTAKEQKEQEDLIKSN